MPRAAPAASRATAIVSLLTANPSRGFTISELVQHLRMNIASAHATLAVLCDAGFLVRDPFHRTYVLGPALAAAGFATLDRHPAISAAIEQTDVLAEELDAEVGVSAVAGRDLILLARRGPESPVSRIGYPGDRSPLLAPFGAVFMAWADDATVSAWLKRAGASPSTADLYQRVLAEARTIGFCVPMHAITAPAVSDALARLRRDPTEDAEHDLTDALHTQPPEMLLQFEGLSATDEVTFKTVAAPVFDPMERVSVAISITGPEHPVRVEHVFRLGERLVRAAAIATRQARGRIPDRDVRAGVASEPS